MIFNLVNRKHSIVWTGVVSTLLGRTAFANVAPVPTGPYVTGVHDFEFVDTTYPSSSPTGRRLMGRVWYPACLQFEFQPDTNTCIHDNAEIPFSRKRALFEPGEFEATALHIPTIMSPFMDLTALFEEARDGTSNSFIDAPPLGASGTSKSLTTRQAVTNNLPLVVFSHGGASTVGSSTFQMEELASHGYVVVSVAHPGWAAGIMYPNGDTMDIDENFVTAMFMDADPSDGVNDSDITNRYIARKARAERTNTGLAAFVPRGRDDLMAMVDYLEQVSSTSESLVLRSLGISSGQRSVVYMGHSYGGCLAASAAHVDPRAIGVINLDGTHQYKDLLGTQLRVPMLTLVTETLMENYAYYTNEFNYEPLASMGRYDSRMTVLEISLQNTTI